MRKNLFFNLLPKIVILIFLFINVQQSNSLTIKSGQIISSDGKIYEFASPKEKEFLIKKSKTHGKSMGIFNNNLFLIIDEKILFVFRTICFSEWMLSIISFISRTRIYFN